MHTCMHACMHACVRVCVRACGARVCVIISSVLMHPSVKTCFHKSERDQAEEYRSKQQQSARTMPKMIPRTSIDSLVSSTGTQPVLFRS